MHLNSKLIFEKYAVKYFKDNLNILEIGPAGYPSAYSRIVANPSIKWNTLDIASDFIAKGENNPLHITSKELYNYPIEENSFDLVISGQVIEHVQDIWNWMQELNRITKKGGFIIIISPISWDYHECPIDCWRIYPDGMEALLNKCNLKKITCKFESLEKDYLPPYARTYPGISTLNLEGKLPKHFKFILPLHRIRKLKAMMREISVAYDCITICQKPI